MGRQKFYCLKTTKPNLATTIINESVTTFTYLDLRRNYNIDIMKLFITVILFFRGTAVIGQIHNIRRKSR